LDWYGATSSPDSKSNFLDARIPNAGTTQISSFSLGLTLPAGQTITAGTTYVPSTQAGVSLEFGYDLTSARFYFDSGSYT